MNKSIDVKQLTVELEEEITRIIADNFADVAEHMADNICNSCKGLNREVINEDVRNGNYTHKVKCEIFTKYAYDVEYTIEFTIQGVKYLIEGEMGGPEWFFQFYAMDNVLYADDFALNFGENLDFAEVSIIE